MAIVEWFVDAGATGANNGTSWANAYTALSSVTAKSPGADRYKTYVKGYAKSVHDYGVFVPNFAGSEGSLHEWYFNGDNTTADTRYFDVGGGAFINGLTVKSDLAWARVKGHYNVYKASWEIDNLRSVFLGNVIYTSGLPRKLWELTSIPYDGHHYTFYNDTANNVVYLSVPSTFYLSGTDLIGPTGQTVTIEYGTAVVDCAATIGTAAGYHKIVGGIFIGGYTNAPFFGRAYVELNKITAYGGFGTGAVTLQNNASGSKINYSKLINFGRASTNGLLYLGASTTGVEINNSILYADSYAFNMLSGATLTATNNLLIDVPWMITGVGAAGLTETNNFYGSCTKKWTGATIDTTNAQKSPLPLKILTKVSGVYTQVTNGAFDFPTGVNDQVWIGCEDRGFTSIKLTFTQVGAGYTISTKFMSARQGTLSTLVTFGDGTANLTQDGGITWTEPAFVSGWPDGGTAEYFGWWVALNVDAKTAGNQALGVTVSSLNSNADGKFTDWENLDFRPLLGSMLINQGTSVGLTTDFDGNPIIGIPDIGSYEYGQAASHGLYIEMGM